MLKKYAQQIRATIIMLVTVVVFGVAMWGLNFHTAPIIEANQAGAELAELTAVMPNGKKFEKLYDYNNPADAKITVDAAHKVNAFELYKETNGAGYVFKLQEKGFSQTISITVGLTTDGKIIKINYTVPAPDYQTKPGYKESYEGQDSTLAGVEVTGGATETSKAIKLGVSKGFAVLISNDLIKAGVKSDAQILKELIPTVHSGLATIDGTLKVTEEAGTGNIETIYKSLNGSGNAYIVKNGDATVLAVTNAMGVCKVYDVEGNDVTAANEAVKNEVLTHANANAADYKTKAENKFKSMMSLGDATITAINATTHNSVVYAAEFDVNGAKHYGFYARTLSFGDEVMEIFIVVDANGAIAKLSCSTYIFHEEYFTQFGGMPSNYEGGFVGVTEETFTDQATIATATMSSNGVKQATQDAFKTFNSVKGGNE